MFHIKQLVIKSKPYKRGGMALCKLMYTICNAYMKAIKEENYRSAYLKVETKKLDTYAYNTVAVNDLPFFLSIAVFFFFLIL